MSSLVVINGFVIERVWENFFPGTIIPRCRQGFILAQSGRKSNR